MTDPQPQQEGRGFPRVIGRAPQTEDTEASVTVRMSAKPSDVIHMDLKRGESLTDEEAVTFADCLRAVREMQAGRDNLPEAEKRAYREAQESVVRARRDPFNEGCI